ncbi:hypothetical protein [Bacillus paralicheniformis]|uniref:hypothetical protein n=1 Tax=Bacillus paralicheniformis TaxID=1648923 RepID=UPI00189D523A|nr:hypothetical protein [Bacillus paralicheniformis]
MIEKQFYVMFPLKMFSYENKGFIDKNETDALLVFFILGKLSNFHERTLTFCNVEMLESQLEFDPKNKQRSKKRVGDALLVLESKGYIKMTYEGELTKAPLIEVETIQEHEDSVSGGSTFSGYVKVFENVFQLADSDGKLFKILVYTLWRQNIDYSISYKEWSKVLGIAESTTKRVLKEYKEQGKIVVQNGSYYRDERGQVKQEMNKYSVPIPQTDLSPLHSEQREIEPTVTAPEETKEENDNAGHYRFLDKFIK